MRLQMKYLEAATIQWQLGNIDLFGHMGYRHVTQPTDPTSEHHQWLAENHQSVYDVPLFLLPVKRRDSIMEGYKNQREWAANNKYCIYWITSKPFGEITSHDQIIKIGMTSQALGLIGRFNNYNMGIFYKGGERTNIAVYNALRQSGLREEEPAYIYYQVQESMRIETQGFRPVTCSPNMLDIEKMHSDWYRESYDVLPTGCKQ